MMLTSPPRIGDESKLRLGRTAIVHAIPLSSRGKLSIPGQQPDRVAGLSGYRRDRKPQPNERAAPRRGRRATFLHISSPSHQLRDFEHEPTEPSEADTPEKHGGGHGDPPSLERSAFGFTRILRFSHRRRILRAGIERGWLRLRRRQRRMFGLRPFAAKS